MLAKQALRRPVALGAARACSSSATTSGRPGARAAEMEKAADKVQSGKNAWQKTVGGIVDAIRPITSALAPTIMPILDAPYQRGVRNAVNIDDLQAVAERRALFDFCSLGLLQILLSLDHGRVRGHLLINSDSRHGTPLKDPLLSFFFLCLKSLCSLIPRNGCVV